MNVLIVLASLLIFLIGYVTSMFVREGKEPDSSSWEPIDNLSPDVLRKLRKK